MIVMNIFEHIFEKISHIAVVGFYCIMYSSRASSFLESPAQESTPQQHIQIVESTYIQSSFQCAISEIKQTKCNRNEGIYDPCKETPKPYTQTPHNIVWVVLSVVYGLPLDRWCCQLRQVSNKIDSICFLPSLETTQGVDSNIICLVKVDEDQPYIYLQGTKVSRYHF